MEERIEELLNVIEEGVKAVFDGAEYKEFLLAMKKFKNYSINNMILILSQCPDATLVASYTIWKELERYVMKGARGIKIIAPSQHKKTIKVNAIDEDGNEYKEEKEIKYNTYRAVHVFDVSQTDGKPIPELVHELNNPVENFFKYMSAINSIAPVPIRFDDINGGAKGYYSPSEIVIQRGMSEEQTLKTMLHEVAHARLGHGLNRNELNRMEKELQAESTAFIVANFLGMDTSSYSFPYLASWSSGRKIKELRSCLEEIKDESMKMIEGINVYMHGLEMKQDNLKVEDIKISKSLKIS